MVKESQLGVFFHMPQCTVTLNSNLKLFSIRIKELFEPRPIVFLKKKANGFLLFLKAFFEKLIF